MSFLSISSKKTRVHLSAEHLSTVTSENSHDRQECCVSDVSILPLSKSFIQIFKSSKNSWVNIYKIKQEDDTETIQLCVKNKVDQLTAIGASKKKGLGLSYATGYSNGQIKIRELKNSKLINEFSAPTSASSVFFLDFNSCDEFLASVHEDGLINVYGMQTSVKLHSFTLDNQSTLARFHPQKRSHLGVASYSGKVYLLDVFAKKAIYKADGHSAPCSDIVMSEDYILSSGYDGMIKIFDLRKKSPGLQIQTNYGWTSIALSICGLYLVGGTLKGELMSYDMRNIKKPLASSRIESSNNKISRVAFLSDDDNALDFSKTVRQSLCKIEEEIDGKAFGESNDDFIEDIVAFQRGRISDFSSSAMSGARVSTASRRASTESRFSDVYGRNMQEALNDFASPSSVVEVDDSRVNKSRRRTVGQSIGVIPMEEINEELTDDKENDAKIMNNGLDVQKSPTVFNNSPRFSSTPTIILPDSSKVQKKKDDKENEVIEIKDESFRSALQTPPISTPNVDEVKVLPNFDFRKEFDALAEKVHVEVGMLNMDQNMRYIEIMSHVGEQRRQLQNRIQMIEESMAILLNDDFKINLINELQAENQQLRQQNNDLLRRLSH